MDYRLEDLIDIPLFQALQDKLNEIYSFPSAIIDRIFDPFYTTKEVGKGTGIGLTIARSLVERHEGRIEVDNRPGKGVTFAVVLPVAAA